MRQAVHFTRGHDGTRIAYGISGDGPPVVKTPNWLTHLEYDLSSPGWIHWIEFLSERWTLYRLDQRGSGLSDWHAADLSFDRWVDDLECVVRTAGLDRFTLLGVSQGGAVAIEYAARYPEKVERLVLYGAYAQGWSRRGDAVAERQGRAMLELIETGWGAENSAYRQLFTSLFMPDANEAQWAWFNELQRVSTRPEIAARLVAEAGNIDVAHRLEDVRAPTLVVHASRDARVPFEQGRQLAAGIAGARLVSVDTRNHALLENDPAWAAFCKAFAAFVPAARKREPRPRLETLTPRERQVFDLIVQGLSNGGIASTLRLREKTVRNHLTNIFSKLGVHTRVQAVLAARDLDED